MSDDEVDGRAFDMSAPKTFERVRAHQSPALAFAQRMAGSGAIEAVAQGAEVTLSDGRTAIDFGSYAIPLFGHRHPDITAAVHRQLDHLPTSSRVLANGIGPALASRLVFLSAPSSLQRVWLGQNGCDAVEASLKLARLTTGRTRVLAVAGGFHGKSLGALAATSSERYRRGLEALLKGVTHIDVEPDAVAAEVAAGDVAALIFEPIQGEGGIVPLPDPIVRRWIDDAHRAGAFVIADEIQCGFGRCGPFSMSIDGGWEVDAVLLGKALGGGVMPISALIGTDALWQPLLRDPFIHTTSFSGHPLSCAAALAATDVLGELQDRAAQLATRVETGLHDLARAHPEAIVDVRGRGLLWGVDLATVEVAGALLVELGHAGVLVSPCLGRPEVIRLLPPMVVSDAQVDLAFERFASALTEAIASVEA